MGEQWPSMTGRQMDKILRRICGAPRRQSGSHRMFVSLTGDTFTFAVHDRKTIPGGLVRRILVEDVGLHPDQARKEAR